MAVQRISTGYAPRPWQSRIHRSKKKRNVIVVHRRGGKTVLFINEIADESVKFTKMSPFDGSPLRNPQYAYIANTIGQAKKVAWDYLKHYTKNFPGWKAYENELKVTYDHPRGKCTIYCLGADNYDAHRGLYFDGIVYDEFADMHPDVRDKVFNPTLDDRDGWEIVGGTPKGDNRFKQLYLTALADAQNPNSEWFCTIQSIYDTGVFQPHQIENMKKQYSLEAWRQEYECDFSAAPAGYYYQRLMDEALSQGRITSVPHDPSSPVSTYWDIGVSDSTAIWFAQEQGKEIHMIDYMEDHGKGLDFWVRQVHQRPYNYNAHVFPHDIAARSLETAKPRITFLHEQGLRNVRVMPKSASVADDVEAVRRILPKIWFDAVKCKVGIEALRAYQRKWDPLHKVFSDKPQHDFASHAADAIRQFAMAYEPGFGRHWGEERNDLPETADSSYDIHG